MTSFCMKVIAEAETEFLRVISRFSLYTCVWNTRSIVLWVATITSTCDVGAHTHLIGQLWRPYAPGNFVMTNGWSAMGFGIPAALAAKHCLPDRAVACVTGDGGFLMMVGEMATAARMGLPVIFVVLTDRNLQLIKIKQERRGYPQYGTALYTDAYRPAPQYFGVPVITANDPQAFHEAFATALTLPEPVIIEAVVDPNEYDALILKPHK